MPKTVQAPQQPTAQGVFLLPVFDSGVPVRLDNTSKRERILARLALLAEQQGMPLPAGELVNVEQIVAAQFSDYARVAHPGGLNNLLRAQPNIVIRDERLAVIIEAVGQIECFVAKPVVQALEEARKGLGQFVYSTIKDAYLSGLRLYDTEIICYHLDSRYYELDAFTDEEYAKQLLREEGGDDQEVTPQLMERLRDEYSYWPSDILKDYEGAEYVLNFGVLRQSPYNRPEPLSTESVQAWVDANAHHQLASCVEDAIAARRAIEAECGKAFCWTFDPNLDECDEAIGAVGFLSWDDPSLLLEMANEHEQMAYQGGLVVEEVGRYDLSIEDDPTDEQLIDLIRALKAFLKQWHLFEKLMSHFPIWEEDET
jgi:PRTRC genetic system protein F